MKPRMIALQNTYAEMGMGDRRNAYRQLSGVEIPLAENDVKRAKRNLAELQRKKAALVRALRDDQPIPYEVTDEGAAALADADKKICYAICSHEGHDPKCPIGKAALGVRE